MQTINDRVEEIINERFSGNKNAFATHVGIPPTSMSNYFGKERRSKISVTMIEKILKKIDVDARWLITGEEESRKSLLSQGDYSPVSDSGDISLVLGDAVLTERIKSLEEKVKDRDELLKEKDERISELKDRIEELKTK